MRMHACIKTSKSSIYKLMQVSKWLVNWDLHRIKILFSIWLKLCCSSAGDRRFIVEPFVSYAGRGCVRLSAWEWGKWGTEVKARNEGLINAKLETLRWAGGRSPEVPANVFQKFRRCPKFEWGSNEYTKQLAQHRIMKTNDPIKKGNQTLLL